MIDRAGAAGGSALPDGLQLVAVRILTVAGPTVRFASGPGDRILVAPGDPITPGLVVAEHQRDPRVEAGPPMTAPGLLGSLETALHPGDWWAGDGHESAGPLRRRQPRSAAGELLHPAGPRWRIAGGDHVDPLESPVTGTVSAVVPGQGIVVAVVGRAVPGAFAAGIPTRGRLEHVPGEAGLRAALDVGRAGAILVVDGRIDSEAIIRARAMGVRGVVVAGLAAKDLRDLRGSEARQRASLQPLAPFAVLALEGTARRPLPGPLVALVAALEGREVAIVLDPPLLVFDPSVGEIPSVAPDRVRIRGGSRAGAEGRWLGSVGLRRFAGGVHLEAGSVALDEGGVEVVPLADLERFA